jgi:hypothetical protein
MINTDENPVAPPTTIELDIEELLNLEGVQFDIPMPFFGGMMQSNQPPPNPHPPVQTTRMDDTSRFEEMIEKLPTPVTSAMSANPPSSSSLIPPLSLADSHTTSLQSSNHSFEELLEIFTNDLPQGASQTPQEPY